MTNELDAAETPVRIKTGRELHQAAVVAASDWFVAATDVPGLEDEVAVYVAAFDDPAKGLTDAQRAAFDHFKSQYAAMRNEVNKALFAGYMEERGAVLADHPGTADLATQNAILAAVGFPGLDEMFPDVADPEALVALLSKPAIRFYEQERDGLAYMCLEYSPHWSVHPFGAILHGDRVLAAGTHPSERDDIVQRDMEV